MQQPRGAERRVPLGPHENKLVSRDAVLEVAVLLSVLPHSHARRGRTRRHLALGSESGGRKVVVDSFVSGRCLFGAGRCRRVVVSRPDLDVVWQTEQSAARVVQVVGAAAGEVATGGADVCVEDGVAAEDVVF